VHECDRQTADTCRVPWRGDDKKSGLVKKVIFSGYGTFRDREELFYVIDHWLSSDAKIHDLNDPE